MSGKAVAKSVFVSSFAHGKFWAILEKSLQIFKSLKPKQKRFKDGF
jgi:hypothetical protein